MTFWKRSIMLPEATPPLYFLISYHQHDGHANLMYWINSSATECRVFVICIVIRLWKIWKVCCPCFKIKTLWLCEIYI